MKTLKTNKKVTLSLDFTPSRKQNACAIYVTLNNSEKYTNCKMYAYNIADRVKA